MLASPLHSSVASSTKLLVSTHLNNIRHLSTHYIVTPVGLFIAYLSVHTNLAYLILFLGSYFEAFVGPSFFIPGEVFLLSGSILAGSHVLNIWFVCGVLYGGAILGDSTSYWIGRYVGTSLFHEKNRFLSMKNYRKAEGFIDKYGHQAIFFARLIGPLNKIAPVAAGMFEIPFGTFLLYNIPGVIVGVGEFIVAGYFFGDRYELILLILERYSVLIALLLGLAFFAHKYWKSDHRKKHFKRQVHSV